MTMTGIPPTTPCEVCWGSANHRLTLDGEPRTDFYLCRHCGLFFAGTDISDEELSALYAACDGQSYYATVAETSRAKAQRAIGDLTALIPDSAQIVDLGCGGGHMLRAVAAIQPGWSAVGHDVDSASVEACKAAGLVATTDETCLPVADAVTMLDVAEHVKEPVAFFDMAYRLVKPGGVLYVHTPRRCIWDTTALALLALPGMRKLGVMWLSTRVSVFHLRLWSDASLRRIVRDVGFEVESYAGELELSWPVETYVKVYVQRKFGAPASVQRLAEKAARLVVRFRLMRNKAILVARRPTGT